MIGRKLAHFEIAAKLGEGGMGEVWRAADSKLGREVAIKVLPPAVAEDPERLARFEREAKLLAALNHQNIAGIYEVGEAEGPIDLSGPAAAGTAGAEGEPSPSEAPSRQGSAIIHFLVMELAEGEDLAERLERGPVPLEEALAVTLQMARALEAAHAKGVVHRDLKPGNVKIAPSGEVKVLDFGLAKALDPAAAASSSEPSLSVSPTLTADMTRAGVLLGTAAYMSPEQARGLEADKRSDVWAFGVILYEMLTGKRLFADAGETVSDLLAAVLRADPDWEELPAGTPRPVRRLLRRCLERDPDRRLHDIADARIEIEDGLAAGTAADELPVGAIVESSRPAWRWLLPWGLVVALALLAGWLWSRGDRAVAELPLRKLVIAELEEVSLFGFGLGGAISPDGTAVAYISEGKLWIRRLEELEPRQVPASNYESSPIWSPDSRWIAFPAGRKLWKVRAGGGEPRAVADLPTNVGSFGGGWTEDDRILLTTGYSGILEVSAQGGDLREVLPPDPDTEADFHNLSLLPGGRGALFTIHYKERREGPLALWDGRERKVLLETEGLDYEDPVYSRTGHLLFTRAPTSRGVWAVPFSLDRLEIVGEPFLVGPGADSPTVADDGTLVMLRGAEGEMRELVWVDRAGAEIGVAGVAQPGIVEIALAPDGERVAVSSVEGGGRTLWLQDLVRGTKSQVTFTPDAVTHSAISPSGRRIAYQIAAAEPQIYVVDVAARSVPVLIGAGGRPEWTPDGAGLVYELYGARGIWYVEVGDAGPAGQPRLLLDPPADESEPAISPDGRWLAYSADESGRFEVYLTRFPDGEGKWQVSADGGSLPRWNPEGDQIFFLGEDGAMLLAAVTIDESPTIGAPVRLFDGIPYGLGGQNEFAVASGDRLLVSRGQGGDREKPRLILIQSWIAEFAGR